MSNSIYDLVSEDPECTDCGSTDLEVLEYQGEKTRYVCLECGREFWLPEEES